MKNIDPKVKKVLAEHEIYSINSEKFIEENHEMDNWIIFDTDSILAGNSTTKIVGYNEHPSWNERDDSLAVMFEDKHGNEFWCHVPGNHFEPWNIGNIFHDEELANLENDFDFMWD